MCVIGWCPMRERVTAVSDCPDCNKNVMSGQFTRLKVDSTCSIGFWRCNHVFSIHYSKKKKKLKVKIRSGEDVFSVKVISAVILEETQKRRDREDINNKNNNNLYLLSAFWSLKVAYVKKKDKLNS